MSEKTIAEKLLLKPGRSLLILNAPAGYLESLGPLPDFAKIVPITEPADVVQLFIYSFARLEIELPKTKPYVNAATIFWVCYPKQSGTIKTDINRDVLYVYAESKNWKGIGMFSVNNDWSAMRFKPQ
jgi:hypothetical protein